MDAADLYSEIIESSVFLLIIFIYRKFISQFLTGFCFFMMTIFAFEVDSIIFVLAGKVKALIFQKV